MLKRLSDRRLSDMEEVARSRVLGAAESAVFGICGDDGKPFRFVRLADKIPHDCDGPADILIPMRLAGLLKPKRLKVIYGGRGSAKTRTVVSILTEMSRSGKERVVCLREIMDSLEDSSYQEIEDEINRRGLADDFKLIERKIKCFDTGSSFGFAGLYRNQTKIKGYAGASKAWCDEAENISRASWDILFPTLRAAGSEIWITFNPNKPDDPTWADIVAPYHGNMVGGVYEDDDVLIIECNHTHNPWLTHELKLERDKMARNDPDRHAWIWEGKFKKRSTENVLHGKWVIDEFTAADDWNGPYFGADFGFSQDPSTLSKCWVTNDNRLMIEHEAGGVGIETDELPALYDAVPGSGSHVIRADGARPETISALCRSKSGQTGRVLRVVAADKWPGSVEDGIAHLRSYDQIVIHPRCKKTIAEAGKWSYKVDKLTGEPLPVLVSGNDHYWDSVRYALSPVIRGAMHAGRVASAGERPNFAAVAGLSNIAKTGGWR